MAGLGLVWGHSYLVIGNRIRGWEFRVDHPVSQPPGTGQAHQTHGNPTNLPTEAEVPDPLPPSPKSNQKKLENQIPVIHPSHA